MSTYHGVPACACCSGRVHEYVPDNTIHSSPECKQMTFFPLATSSHVFYGLLSLLFPRFSLSRKCSFASLPNSSLDEDHFSLLFSPLLRTKIIFRASSHLFSGRRYSPASQSPTSPHGFPRRLLTKMTPIKQDVAPRSIKNRIDVRPAKPHVKRLHRKGPLLGSWSRPIVLDDVSSLDESKHSPIVIEADSELGGSICKPIELEDDSGDEGSRSNPIVILDDPAHEPDQDSFTAAE